MWQRTVLIADDEPMMRRLVQEALAIDGLLVSNQTIGGEASGGGPIPDVVIVDVKALRWSPFEILRAVETLSQSADAPVVMVWTETDMDSTWKELEPMCERALPGNLDPHELITLTLEMVLRRSRAAVVNE